jgi:hypothetical protein
METIRRINNRTLLRNEMQFTQKWFPVLERVIYGMCVQQTLVILDIEVIL